MKTLLTSGCTNQLGAGHNKRLQHKFPDIEATVRMASVDGLSVRNGTPADREAVEEVLQETWESADDWFQTWMMAGRSA
ncbi:DinI-like family protein [Serratia quinivorans]|uniref:DinI-like family protein n=1 Tax=Serratia quinivorans TaxID=137545 RepID=UPI0036F3ACC2